MKTAQLVPAILAPVILWRLYRRIRRNIGQQTFHARRLTVSAIFLVFALGLATFFLLRVGISVATLLEGFAAGALLGFVGYKITHFETGDDLHHYTPNPYLRGAIVLLFFGRIVYRFLLVSSDSGLSASPVPALHQSPLTLFFLGLPLGYYLVYQTLVVLHFRRAEK